MITAPIPVRCTTSPTCLPHEKHRGDLPCGWRNEAPKELYSSNSNDNIEINDADTSSLELARKRVKQEYDKLSSVFKEAYENVSSLQFRHNKLIEQQEQYRKTFKNQINIIRAEAKRAFEQIVWEHLVIGFFGETNAGKSTIIEALRLKYSATPGDHVPGDIIGNGQADFTKEASEYELNVDGHRVTLIDVPGIEGDEAKYSDIIKHALSKVHLIFYVQSKNKKPDCKIADKIKDYLADWTRVYTIYNIRGNIGGYEDEEELDNILTPYNVKIAQEISSVFRATLKENYNDIITMQGLLAVTACDEFAEDKNKHKNHLKACKIFGSTENILQYSNFYELVNLLKNCIGDVSDNIYKSNIQKIIGLRKKGYTTVLSMEERQRDEIDKLREAFDKLRQDIKYLVSKAENSLANDYKTIVTEKFNKAKSSIISIIDNRDYSTDQKKAKCGDISHSLPKDVSDVLESNIRNTCNKLLQDIKKKIEEFQRMSINLPKTLKIDNLKLNLDLGYDMEDLDINFEDIVGVVGKIIGCAATGSFFGPIGMAIGAAIGTGISIYNKISGDGGRGKAKQKISAELDVCRKETIDKIKYSIDSVINQLENQRKSIDNKILDEIRYLSDKENILSELSHKLKYLSNNA